MSAQTITRHVGVFSGLAAKVNAWRRYHNTMSELYALDQRELDDLGIGTGDFDDLARGRNIADRRS